MSRHPRLPARGDLEIPLMLARGVSIDQAAAYAGRRPVPAFRDWVRRELMRGPLPGIHRYDRKATDAALDRMSGIAPTMPEPA
jgi:hypothetical protein